jgi:hypothetical protein
MLSTFHTSGAKLMANVTPQKLHPASEYFIAFQYPRGYFLWLIVASQPRA